MLDQFDAGEEEDYSLGLGDQITDDVWNIPSFPRSTRLDPTGKITIAAALLESNADLFRLFSSLIQFRKTRLSMHCRSFDGPDAPPITWHGLHSHEPDWSLSSRGLGMMLHDGSEGSDIMMFLNSFWEGEGFALPKPNCGRRWYRPVDTAFESARDITEISFEQLCDQNRYRVKARSVVILVSK